jgi:hypothetical protein
MFRFLFLIVSTNHCCCSTIVSLVLGAVVAGRLSMHFLLCLLRVTWRSILAAHCPNTNRTIACVASIFTLSLYKVLMKTRSTIGFGHVSL